jgi:tryptophan synthase alpha chain
MSRIGACFRALRSRGERALVPFVTAGDPDLSTTEALVPALAEAGADLIELGVPFSDPVAEGPTIQRASERALASGTTARRVLELVKGLRPRLDVPLVLMGYANVFLTMGERSFAEAAQAAGVDGVICVDLPPEEGVGLRRELEARGVDPILLAAPTTTPERLAFLARETRGFLYYVSLTGVTGARAELARGIEAQVRRVRESADIPVCVGFGVSTPEHARRIGAFADGVVVGSALVERIANARDREQAVDAAARFVAELKQPLREPIPSESRLSS